MAFLRRRGPEPGTDYAPVATGPVATSVGETCPFCDSEIVVDADSPSELLVAMLLDQPGFPQHLVAHRACAENAAGRRLP
jgi:hypothetical protein